MKDLEPRIEFDARIKLICSKIFKIKHIYFSHNMIFSNASTGKFSIIEQNVSGKKLKKLDVDHPLVKFHLYK